MLEYTKNVVDVYFSPYMDKVLVCFHIQVFREQWVLEESRILLKPVLKGMEFVDFPIILLNRCNKLSLLLLNYVGSVFF